MPVVRVAVGCYGSGVKKKFLKWTLCISAGLAALIVLLVVIVALAFDPWLRSVAVKRIHEQTGQDVKIGRLSVSFLSRKFLVENFVLYNTAEFGGGPMINLPELRLELDPVAMRAHKLHFKLIRLHLAEVSVVQDKAGRSNFEGLHDVFQPKPHEQKMQFDGIDTLNLTLGVLRHTDLRVSAQPRTYQLGLKNEIVSDIKNEEDARAKLLPILMKISGNVFRDMLAAPEKPKVAGE